MLERKSMRLKVLIEDLFDISKASSKNITLNLTDVDVVNLFKQVKLELDEKIEKADLEFKCNYPGRKDDGCSGMDKRHTGSLKT